MAKYMTQSMTAGIHSKVTYYRQCSAHPSHTVSSGFTTDAKNSYAAKYGISASTVEEGKYMSNQGVPYGGVTEEI
jgi:hypothetical protein